LNALKNYLPDRQEGALLAQPEDAPVETPQLHVSADGLMLAPPQYPFDPETGEMRWNPYVRP